MIPHWQRRADGDADKHSPWILALASTVTPTLGTVTSGLRRRLLAPPVLPTVRLMVQREPSV